MRIVSGKTVSETINKAVQTLLNEGTQVGRKISMFDTTLEFTNSRSRHLYLKGHQSNVFKDIAETFWVMAGANSIHGYLEFFNTHAKQCSVDGNTWSFAHGPRMYRYNQINNVIETFKSQGQSAIITIADPSIDYPDYFGEVPASREIHFYIEDNKFHAKTIQSSSDIMFTHDHISPFEFSFLHELIFNEIIDYCPDLELGSYRWHVTEMFIPARVYQSNLEDFYGVPENNIKLIGPAGGPEAWPHFFGSLISQFGSMISQDDNTLHNEKKKHGEEIVELFNQYGIKSTSLMWEYVGLVFDYIVGIKNRSTNRLQIHDTGDWLEGDLLRAVKQSSYRKFGLN